MLTSAAQGNPLCSFIPLQTFIKVISTTLGLGELQIPSFRRSSLSFCLPNNPDYFFSHVSTDLEVFQARLGLEQDPEVSLPMAEVGAG